MRAARYIGVGIATLGIAAAAAAPVSAVQAQHRHNVFLAKIRYQAKPEKGVNGEYVKLTNGRDYFVNLKGWTLTERYAGRVFAFPDKWLAPGASVWLYSGMGRDHGADLYWNSRTFVWHNESDTAKLRNGRSTKVDTLAWKSLTPRDEVATHEGTASHQGVAFHKGTVSHQVTTPRDTTPKVAIN